MQLPKPVERRKIHRKIRMRQARSATGPQPSRPGILHPDGPYGVRVRNIQRGTWAALVRSVREASGMPKVELARRLGIDRATVSRWETGTTRPEDAAVVQRFADLFGLDLDETLSAAGLRPQPAARPAPQPPMDPSILRLLQIMADPATTEDTRQQIVAMLKVLNEMADARPRRPKRKAV